MSEFNSVVDTRGINENPIRKDLQEYIDRQDTICLFTTKFSNAPESNIRELMRYYLTSKSKNYHHRFVTFVTPRQGEPAKVNGGDGSWELGTLIRREDIQGTFRNLNLEFFPENIFFYDALRYYNDAEIVKLNTDIYSEEDVQRDRDDCLQAIAGVVERRKRILLEEVETIKESFAKIRSGKILTQREVEVIESTIHQIKYLRKLSQKIPGFVYEDFIENYISYYRNIYKAWNTKHKIRIFSLSSLP